MFLLFICILSQKSNTYGEVFEAITAAAMLYFYEQKCDAVVLEVGLGGLQLLR